MSEPKKSPRSKTDKKVGLENLSLEMGNKPPQAVDFEEAVLGALLIEPNCVDEAMEELTPSCFYEPKHRMIFEAMVKLVNEHVSIDLLSVFSHPYNSSLRKTFITLFLSPLIRVIRNHLVCLSYLFLCCKSRTTILTVSHLLALYTVYGIHIGPHS